MTAATYARLRVTDPGRWRSAAAAWRALANLAGRWSEALSPLVARLVAAWFGRAAQAASARLGRSRGLAALFRVLCWETDQVLSEFAAALERARRLLASAIATATRAGAVVGDEGTVTGPRGAAVDRAAVQRAAADLAAALAVADRADATAAERLGEVAAVANDPGAPDPPRLPLPPCTATPAEVRRWWDGLTPTQRRWLAATRPGWLGPLDGVPAGFRDLANRLSLDDRRAELDRAAAAPGADRHRIDGLRRGLSELSDRLADSGGPRAYLMGLDVAGEGRVVLALGDPDRADNVLTHVPGMTGDLASYGGELLHAERVAIRAGELGPAAATSTVLWLGYDAPDFLNEAASARQARAGAVGLRRFEEGLRATHEGEPARQTVLGHSYGSLVVGEAAAGMGLDADGVVFVASPGVGVDSAARLRVPAGEVWSTTAHNDIIQYAAVAPRGLIDDVTTVAARPALGLAVAVNPQEHLWFGRNPSDPSFGAHVFASQPDAGHLGYWDRSRPALDAIARIALGTAR